MIPRRLIQTHKNKSSLNLLHRKCQRTLLRLHPEYEYRFFSDRDCVRFIKERLPGFLPLWHFYPRPVQRADLFRVLAVYELGGFYFDLDVFFHEPLDDLLGSEIVFPEEWQMSKEFYAIRHRVPAETRQQLVQLGNYAFGARPRHWFLREVLEEMIRRTGETDTQNLTDMDVLFSTGPDCVNGVARKEHGRLETEITRLQGDPEPQEPLPVKEWGDPQWFQFGRYANHLMTGVWKEKQ